MREMKDSGIKWIGQIPQTWEVKRCKMISNFINGYAFDSSKLKAFDFKFPVIKIGDIQKDTVDFYNCQGVDNNEGLKNYQIKSRDILLAMSGATVGKVGYVYDTPYHSYINQRVGIIRTIFPKFLFYSLVTSQFVEYISLMSNGSAQPNVSEEVFGNYPITYPPIQEQQKIAEFLDKECGKIDETSAEIEKQIETLEELKRSIISEAVTKGLNKSAEMKDSGVSYVGKIPENWKVNRGKFIFNYVQKLVKEDDGVITCFRDGEVTLRSNRREDGFTISEKEIGYQGIDVGDLIVHGMDGFAGAIGISDSRGKASPVLNNLQTNQSKRFYMYYLRNMAYKGVFIALATGIRVRTCDTNWGKLREIYYAIPPLKEQQEIADYLDKKCAEIDSIIEEKNKQLEVLEKYKKSLIYEYVTGKKEVV